VLGFRSGQASVVGVNSQQVNTFNVHRLDINSVSISKDGKFAFTGSSDKLANLWHTSTGDIVKSFEHKMRVNHVTLTPDAKMAFSLDAVSDRFFWTLPQGKLFSDLQISARFLEFNHAEFSNNKQWYLTASPKQKIRLWSTITGNLHSQWLSFKHPNRKRSSVLTVKFINNNKFASITSDGAFQLWEIPTTN
jgi:WD40 repeat protein